MSIRRRIHKEYITQIYRIFHLWTMSITSLKKYKRSLSLIVTGTHELWWGFPWSKIITFILVRWAFQFILICSTNVFRTKSICLWFSAAPKEYVMREKLSRNKHIFIILLITLLLPKQTCLQFTDFLMREDWKGLELKEKFVWLTF